jgi:hypothetical protein
MRHLFKHPEDFDDELIAFLRAPKRRDRLNIGRGWGIELVEGYSQERLGGALLVLLLFGSLVLALSMITQDLRRALGVAGLAVSSAGLALLSMQPLLA